MRTDILQKLWLDSNPFEPSATGEPLSGVLSPPNALAERMENLFSVHETGEGVKAIVIVGEYGTGKTCLLQWLHGQVCPRRQIKSFYFDNPGVQFYDLANMLLRTIGRKDFAKFIWELAGSKVNVSYQRTLFQSGFEEYLSNASHRRRQQDMTSPLQDAVKIAGITTDEEIAHCLARIVTDIVKKPYFEFRDFIPQQKGSMVPEGEEAPYFRAILKTISQGTGAKAIAFLIDEFEEIGLQKRLTKRAAHDYLATLKRLINLAQSQQVDFWIILSMTPDAYEITKELEPSLIERVSDQTIKIDTLTKKDALKLMKSRIAAARLKKMKESTGVLFPFPDDVLFRPSTYSNPRRLVKTCFRAIAQADADVQLPFTKEYLYKIEDELYPSLSPTGNAKP
ncbi:MAG: AAA family ATPase [Nitrospira sp.]|nr:AAA family ATPase [Nitrospira sp.]